MRRLLCPLALLTVAFLLGASSPKGAAPLASPVVETEHGDVRGLRGDGFQAFLGIPYAAPPVGPRRWRRPAPSRGWHGVRDARATPPRCTQRSLGLPLASQEDCLYLNVHAPEPLPENAPVMVWIHGGSFTIGEGLQTDGGTAGDVLASRLGAVVVSMNYRLGAFGFLAPLGEGDASSRTRSAMCSGTGNLGIADQAAALRWVQRNIAAFGGDPENVTLFGESAGGRSVCAHLVSPESRGLFQRAIVQSGFCARPTMTRERAEDDARELAARLGCDAVDTRDTMSCLRTRSTKAILKASEDIAPSGLGTRHAWRPYVDGEVLPDDIEALVDAGAFADVPVIVGWNGDEGSLDVLFASLSGERFDARTYREVTARLAARHGVAVEAIRAQYPAGTDPAAALSRALGDATLACPSRRFARKLADRGAEVYAYRFTYDDAEFQIPFLSGLGAFHSAEIQYVFGRPAGLFTREFSGVDEAIHTAMAGAWARFAQRGAPGEGWPRFDAEGARHLVFDREIAVRRGADADACALWDTGAR